LVEKTALLWALVTTEPLADQLGGKVEETNVPIITAHMASTRKGKTTVQDYLSAT